MGAAPDDEILDFAIGANRVLIASDTDFSALYAFRRLAVEEPLSSGSIAILRVDRIRIRDLPI